MGTEENSRVSEAIRQMCKVNLGVLDKSFLCQSLSVLEPKKPFSVRGDEPLSGVLEKLQAKKIGCVVIVDEGGKLTGIFSERDFILKVAHQYDKFKSRPVSEFMTKDPVSQPPSCTIAFALNLMSQGGFRHIPIVDTEHHPVGIISVKDVVDYLVHTLTEDLLNFPLDGV